MANWELECDTTGDGTFDESITNLKPFGQDADMTDQWETGRFRAKRTNYTTDGSIDVPYHLVSRNKRVSFRFKTSFPSIVKLQEWHQMTCHEYTHQVPRWQVRLKDADGNVLAISSSKYAFCLLAGLNLTNFSGDPGKIEVGVDLVTVGYK